MLNVLNQMRKPHVFVVAGAGASKPFGFPLTHELTQPVLSRLSKLLKEPVLWAGSGGNPTSPTRQQLLDEVLRTATSSPGRGFNFERWYGSLESQFADLSAKDRNAPDYDERFFLLSVAMHAILGVVLEQIDAQSQRYRAEYSELVERQRAFFERLGQSADFTVLNLNYDDVLFDALGGDPGTMGFVPQAASGDDASEQLFSFAPPRTFFEVQPRRLLHLHGHYRLRTDGGSGRMSARDAQAQWNRTHVGQYDQSTHRLRPVFPVISGDEKPWAMGERPFLSYYGAATIAAHHADSVLVIGYGDGDAHVGKLLEIAGAGDRTGYVQINPACTQSSLPARFLSLGMGVDQVFRSDELTERVVSKLVTAHD